MTIFHFLSFTEPNSLQAFTLLFHQFPFLLMYCQQLKLISSQNSIMWQKPEKSNTSPPTQLLNFSTTLQDVRSKFETFWSRSSYLKIQIVLSRNDANILKNLGVNLTLISCFELHFSGKWGILTKIIETYLFILSIKTKHDSILINGFSQVIGNNYIFETSQTLPATEMIDSQPKNTYLNSFVLKYWQVLKSKNQDSERKMDECHLRLTLFLTKGRFFTKTSLT